MDSVVLRQQAAEVLSVLRDPNVMILRADEGQGSYFLPILYEVRQDGVWLIGGDAAQVKSALGPISRINGKPLPEFLAEHIGRSPSAVQMFEALNVLGHREAPFEWVFEGPQGSINISSSAKEPTSIWVEGGLKGEAWAHTWNIESKASKLDFRTLHWFDALGYKRLEGLKMASLLETSPVSTQRVTRNNKGAHRFGGGVWQGLQSYPYSQTVAGEPVTGLRFPVEVVSSLPKELRRHFVFELPPAVGINGSDMLAGWALPSDLLAPSDLARWEIAPGVVVQMPIGTYADHPKLDKSVESPIDETGASIKLTRRAATALVAATVANYDHLFGFTDEKSQQGLFQYLVKSFQDGRYVEEFLPGTVPFTKDGHANSPIFELGPVGGSDEVISQGWLPFEAELDNAGRLLVIRSGRVEIPVGAEIKSLDGKPITELLSRAKSTTPGIQGDRTSWIWWGLSGQGDLSGKVLVEFSEGKETHSVRVSRIRTAKSGFLPTRTKLPEGWRLFTPENPGSVEDLVAHLKSGKNAIVDNRLRFGRLPITGDPDTPVLPYEASVAEFIRVPNQPLSWGSSETPRSIMEGSIQDHHRNPALVNGWGKAYFLVSGTTRSAAETSVILQRLRLGDAARIVGLPTVGTTSPLTNLSFPIGDEMGRRVGWSPTPAFPVFEQGTIQFRGVPIDEQPTLGELLSHSEDPDPLFAWLIARARHESSVGGRNGSSRNHKEKKGHL
jgi:hypothetical protein